MTTLTTSEQLDLLRRLIEAADRPRTLRGHADAAGITVATHGPRRADLVAWLAGAWLQPVATEPTLYERTPRAWRGYRLDDGTHWAPAGAQDVRTRAHELLAAIVSLGDTALGRDLQRDEIGDVAHVAGDDLTRAWAHLIECGASDLVHALRGHAGPIRIMPAVLDGALAKRIDAPGRPPYEDRRPRAAALGGKSQRDRVAWVIMAASPEGDDDPAVLRQRAAERLQGVRLEEGGRGLVIEGEEISGDVVDKGIQLARKRWAPPGDQRPIVSDQRPIVSDARDDERPIVG